MTAKSDTSRKQAISAWGKKNKEKTRQYCKLWRDKNPSARLKSEKEAILKNPELYKDIRKRSYEKNKEKRRTNVDQRTKRMLSSIKHRAKTKNIPFNLTPADISIPTHCPVLGTELKFLFPDEAKHNRDNVPSIDRIIPELGYTKGNIVVISWKANRIKADATLTELELLTNWLKTKMENPCQA